MAWPPRKLYIVQPAAGFRPPRDANLADKNFTAPSAQPLFVTFQLHGSLPHGPWFHHERSIESLKPRASRARSIGGRIRVVKRLEIQRAEACYDSRLKPAAG